MMREKPTLAAPSSDPKKSSEVPGRKPGDPGEPPPLWQWRTLLAAALALTALGIQISRRPHSATTPLVALWEPASGAVLTEAPATLRWPDQEGAELYRVVLFDTAHAPIWRGDWTPSLSQDLPEDVRQMMDPGPHSWVLEVGRQGHADRLGPFPFELTSGRAGGAKTQ